MSILPRRWLLNATIVLSFLMPLISFSQVTIREKVEIKPRSEGSHVSSTKGKPRLSSGSNRFFNPPLFAENPLSGEPQLTLPALLTFSGSVDVHGALGFSQFAILFHGGTGIAWMTRDSYGWGGEVHQGQSTETTSYSAGHSLSIELWLSWNGGGTCDTSVTSTGIDYSFAYTLCCPPIPVTATASVRGSFLPNVGFDHWNVYAGNMTATSRDSTAVSCQPMDGTRLVNELGDTLEHAYWPLTVPPSEAEVTVRVDAKGDYVYLSYCEYHFDEETGESSPGVYHSGKELTVPLGYSRGDAWIMPGVRLIYDDSRGTFDGLTDTVYVTVTGGGKSKTIPVVLTRELTCARVAFNPMNLSVGETATLEFTKEDGSAFAADAKFDVMIVGGGSNPGTIQSSSGSGSFLLKTQSPVSYVAPATIEGDSLVVQVAAYAYESGGGGGGEVSSAMAKVSTVFKKSPRQITAQSMALNSNRSVLERIGKLLANNECQAGKAVVKAKKIPTAISLEVSPEEVIAPGSADLEVTLKVGDITIDAIETDATIDYSLGYEAEKYGQLNQTDPPGTGMTLPSVGYGKTVNILFSKQTFDERFPLKIQVSAGVHGKENLNAVQVFTLVGPHTTGKYFSQSADGWGGDVYDTYKRLTYDKKADSIDAVGNPVFWTITDKGCALSCMAMVLKAFGCDVDPKKLNNWMSDPSQHSRNNRRSGFLTSYGDVDWVYDLLKYPGSPVGCSIPVGENLQPPIPTTALDYNLSLGYPSFVQFSNPRTGNPHWGVVTGKTASGMYTILDPDHRNPSVLDPKAIYKFREVIPK